ncbi:hypothetical protein BGZ68_004878 [Mortierella alpina]|nr:hypothetical protein BGZ68_004878 [Mortierella alpina]
MLALDCATIGLFESMMHPRYEYFYGLLIDGTDYALLLTADLFAIIFFALLVFRPQGLALFNKVSPRVLTGCRVIFSLGLTVLILFAPAMELETIMELKYELNHVDFPDDPDQAHDVYMDFVFCGRRYTPDADMAKTNQCYCKAARIRWFMGFLLGALVLGELMLSYWTRDFKAQQERDGKLQTGTEEYKNMVDFEA